jgi:hypothetical protein
MPRITPVHWTVLEKVFLAAGFRFARQEGSHRSCIKPGIFQAYRHSYLRRIPRRNYQEQLENGGHVSG